jgi:TRAP-type C4-dicarboxylate transport system permease small subunit
MPAPIRRGLNLFASLLVLLFFVLVAYRFIWMTVDSEGSVTPTVLMPTTPTWWVATALLWLTVPVQIWVCWVRVAELITGRDLFMAKPETSAG